SGSAAAFGSGSTARGAGAASDGLWDSSFFSLVRSQALTPDKMTRGAQRALRYPRAFAATVVMRFTILTVFATDGGCRAVVAFSRPDSRKGYGMPGEPQGSPVLKMADGWRLPAFGRRIHPRHTEGVERECPMMQE